jgi:hypothetical protein
MFDDISNYHIEWNIPSTSKTKSVPGSADFNTLDEPIKETIVSPQKTNIDGVKHVEF